MRLSIYNTTVSANNAICEVFVKIKLGSKFFINNLPLFATERDATNRLPQECLKVILRIEPQSVYLQALRHLR